MSTFAEPASATSGLQGYDLEGAGKKKASKEEAGYVADSPTRQCHTCTMFRAPEACTAVKGKISPAGHCNYYKMKEASKSAPPRAAGIALVSRQTGETLFLKRAGDDHGGEWNFPGGGIESGETEEAAALRELFEETGHRLPDDESRTYVGKVINSDIEYTTFAQKVDDKFEPKLNGEHSAFRWASLDYPPDPLHPWVRAALPLVKSAAVDLTYKAAGAAIKEEITMDNLSIFVPVLKVDAAQHMVYGTAVAEEADRAQEIFDYASSKPEFEKWSGEIAKATDGKSLGNVRSMHGHVAAGKLTDIGFNDERKAIDVAAKIVDENEWKKVEEGVYTGFSIGGKYLKRWQDGDLKRYTAAPSEISLVDLPCVKNATFTLVKADGSEELRKFQSGEQLEKSLSTATVKVNVDTTEAIKALDDVTKAAKAAAEAVGAVSNMGSDWEQVWVSKRLPGKSFAKKSELQQALVELDASEAATKKAAEILGDDVVKTPTTEKAESTADKNTTIISGDDGAEKVEAAESVEKREFSEAERKKDAKSGTAESDGSYPIENKGDLENAIRAYGRSKNKAKTKRHIMARARALGLTSMLPADWKAQKMTDGTDLTKDASLYGMSDLMNMLACVECLEDRAEGSSYGFGVELPKDVTDRFGLALVNLGDVVADILDAVLSDIREEERAEAVNRAAPVADMLKAGARVATAETEAAAKATAEKNSNGAVEKAAAAEVVAENADLKSRLAAAEAAFEKKLAEIGEKIKSAKAETVASIAKLTAEKDELHKQVMTIRATPMQAPAGHFRVVDKTADTVVHGAGAVEKKESTADDLRQRGLDAQMSRLTGVR